MNSGLESQDTALTNIMPPDLMFGFSLWVFAFLLGGLAVAGQPQVVSRVMTLGSEKDRKQAMIWFFVWQTPFIILMTFVGLASRVLFPKADSFDPELGLPMLAMDTMPAIGIGMILASIFAATMSTADSQVLACTAAITDDIKPEWREDHKTTKKVTLFVAAFATAISIGGLYVPGGDSVFKLVVLAVYGLGSVFVPLLIIRWMGYKPDSTHSIVMMTSAFTAVMVWSMLPAVMGWKSVTGADGLFPSVPGMGAAFAAHFILNAMRTPDVSSLGRYNWPDRKKIGTFAAAIIIPFAGLEVTYLATAPDSMNSSEPAPDSMWNLTVEFEPHFEEQVINIGDGATDSFQFDIPADAIGVSFMLNYSESNEGGIGSQCDDVESSYDDTNVPSEFRVMWNLQNITGQNCGENPLGGIATWSGFMQTNTYENHQITISELTVEKDAGEIIFDVKVDVNQATPINGDNGEEITLMMRYNTLVSYELTEAE